MLKSLRGGCWYSLPSFLLPSIRYWIEPDVRNDNLGFRLVREVEPERVFRGGSWCGSPSALRAPYARKDDPDVRASTLGFRLACDAGPCRVRRGGSWYAGPYALRASFRLVFGTNIWFSSYGFRLACDPEPQLMSVRGGSWNLNPSPLRASYRLGGEPDYRDDVSGFRLVSENSGNGPAIEERMTEMSVLDELGIALIHVPAGEFLMGSPDGEGYDDEHPQHKRKVKAFDLMDTHATHAAYLKFCEETGHRKPFFADNENLNRPNQPVVGVDYYDCVAFAEWLSKKTGRKFRLPTEVELEYAAKGPEGRKYAWGNEEPTEEHACYWKQGRTGPDDVRSHPKGRSPLGFWDLAGNVWSWTSSEYVSDGYKKLVEKRKAKKAMKGESQG